MPVRKISHSHPDFMNLIYKLADACNLNLKDYVVVLGCEDVESFLKGMYKVQLKGSRDGQKLKINVLLKWHPDPKTRASYRKMYRRECVFYRHIVPNLLEIQRSFKNIEGLKIKFPNCIFASAEYDKEAVAILGLLQDGFRLRDRLYRTDLQHVSLVMKNLAKLHALSFALASINPKEFKEISGLCCEDVQYPDSEPMHNSMRCFFDASVNVVLDAEAKYKLKRLGPHIVKVLHKCTQPDSYSTICQADCWNNNIVFKYKVGRQTSGSNLYRLTRIASPVTDISYFLYMSTDREFLSEHYGHILDIYYDTLTAVLRQCNLDVNTIYPRTIFQKHLQEYSVFGLIEALVSMMIITAEYEEALKMSEIKYENCEETFYEDKQLESSLFVARVNGVVSDFFERDYYLDVILNK